MARSCNLRVAVGNHSIKANLMQVWRLKFQHLVDACSIDGIRGVTNFFGCAVGAAKSSLDQLLTILVEQVKCRKMSTGGNLDELGKPIADLRLWQRPKECKVEKGVDWGMVGTQPILVVAIVDRHLDGDRRIDESNDGRGNTNEVRVAAVCGTRKTVQKRSANMSNKGTDPMKCMGQSALKSSLASGGFYPATSVTSPPPMTSTGS